MPPDEIEQCQHVLSKATFCNANLVLYLNASKVGRLAQQPAVVVAPAALVRVVAKAAAAIDGDVGRHVVVRLDVVRRRLHGCGVNGHGVTRGVELVVVVAVVSMYRRWKVLILCTYYRLVQK